MKIKLFVSFLGLLLTCNTSVYCQSQLRTQVGTAIPIELKQVHDEGSVNVIKVSHDTLYLINITEKDDRPNVQLLGGIILPEASGFTDAERKSLTKRRGESTYNKQVSDNLVIMFFGHNRNQSFRVTQTDSAMTWGVKRSFGFPVMVHESKTGKIHAVDYKKDSIIFDSQNIAWMTVSKNYILLPSNQLIANPDYYESFRMTAWILMILMLIVRPLLRKRVAYLEISTYAEGDDKHFYAQVFTLNADIIFLTAVCNTLLIAGAGFWYGSPSCLGAITFLLSVGSVFSFICEADAPRIHELEKMGNMWVFLAKTWQMLLSIGGLFYLFYPWS